MPTIFHKIIRMFTSWQTYLNLAYLVVNITSGFSYYLILQISLELSWGLVLPTISFEDWSSLDWFTLVKLGAVILSGILVIPILVWILQLPVVPEQWLANLILKEKITLDREMWSKESTLLRPGRLFLAVSTWKRLLFVLIKIPLGLVSFSAFFYLLVPSVALLGMPLAYLAGFRNLVIGAWRFDTIGKAVLAFLAGVIALPLSILGMNLLARFSGWLVRTLLTASKAAQPK